MLVQMIGFLQNACFILFFYLSIDQFSFSFLVVTLYIERNRRILTFARSIIEITEVNNETN